MTSLDPAAVERLEARVRAEVDSGRSHAAQYAIGLGGEVVASGSFGEATDDHRFVIFSATKTIVALALPSLLAEGSLDLTTPVAHYLPEFGENGKHDVTVLQLLTMQGGFPQAPMGPKDWGSSEGRRARMARWRLDWPAGSRTEYHPIAAHWVIAELIEALTGRPYADGVHERVTAPAGARPILAPEVNGPVVPVRLHGELPGTDPTTMAALAEAFGGAHLVPDSTIGPDALLSMNDPRAQAACIPGGGGRAHAADVARTYQHAIADDSPWMRDAVGTVRNVSLSVSDKVPANRTIAGVVAGNDGFHRQRWFPAAPRAFGHHGAGGQLCWGDPQSGLSFCFLHDTLQLDPRSDLLRSSDLNALALACVRP